MPLQNSLAFRHSKSCAVSAGMAPPLIGIPWSRHTWLCSRGLLAGHKKGRAVRAARPRTPPFYGTGFRYLFRSAAFSMALPPRSISLPAPDIMLHPAETALKHTRIPRIAFFTMFCPLFFYDGNRKLILQLPRMTQRATRQLITHHPYSKPCSRIIDAMFISRDSRLTVAGLPGTP